MSATENILTESGDFLISEDSTGGSVCLIVEPFNYSLLNNYMSVTVGNGMSCGEKIR